MHDAAAGRSTTRWREIPPTAGLPLRWHDFVPRPDASLERGFASFIGTPSVQVECSGSAALIVALETLKRGSARRSVVIPAYTCPLVPLAIAHCGLRPVACDLADGHFDMCPRTLEGLCDSDTLAIVPTHLAGRVADVESALRVARRVGAAVIEDAAQALGATWHGEPVGTFGDVGFYSLAAGKGLTLYEGGVIVARDAELRAALHRTSREIVPAGRLWEARRLLELAGYAMFYRPSWLQLAYGVPLRRALRRGKLIEATGDDFSANIPLHRVGAWRKQVGANALKRLPGSLALLAEQAASRKTRLAAIPGVSVAGDSPGRHGVWPFFLVLMESEGKRDAALARLWMSGLGITRLFAHALVDYPYLARHFGTVHTPNARTFAARMLTISNSPWLADEDFEQVCAVLDECARA